MKKILVNLSLKLLLFINTLLSADRAFRLPHDRFWQDARHRLMVDLQIKAVFVLPRGCLLQRHYYLVCADWLVSPLRAVVGLNSRLAQREFIANCYLGLRDRFVRYFALTVL